ncbi:signal transduction histidine kinase [Duganella sp. CF458]|uniref:two-component system sensor histidine kinase CreC n=1 Tax=Duganella sp. CF458 TaxID=1884368 RepID=UPI0008F452AA|nr:two-component system sensor histidine kinase CreC [Duganella sp. CF458]SFF66942.1 signal transduction histidine kinase [Duganella sp. CF458]
MKIGLRILLGYFLIVGLAAWFLLNVFVQEVKPGARSTLEAAMNDTAQLLAQVVADDVKEGASDPVLLAKIAAASRNTDYRITITDAEGIVRFDSAGKSVGKDYSRWNDVYLTLRGQYGARMTSEVPRDYSSLGMYVAAPVRDGDRTIGVLTISKPISSVQGFIERSQRKILKWGIVLLGLSLLIGVAITWRMASTVNKLMVFVEAVQAGRKAVMPKLGSSEISTLGHALEAMRAKLEGKDYVETLMHTLTHELKSPIAAIQAAAELLEEDMPPEQRRQFLSTIQAQNARQRDLIDKLLALVRVEKQQRIDDAAPLDVAGLLQDVAGDFQARLAACSLQLNVDAPSQLQLLGDRLLLRQALGNLLDNAISFSPRGSCIAMFARGDGDMLEIVVADNGPGIPDYAVERVFERFYSLPRPDAPKSTGLGLPFVREVVTLHGGTTQVANGLGTGCRAIVRLPQKS